jgi:NAD+ synthase
VLGLTLPSNVSNPADIKDAAALCKQLSMDHRVISIVPMLEGFKTIPEFIESRYLLGNLMARIRMTILYYHANREQKIVCGTSNRSEYMLGYCTKYGDNAADLQPLLHLYKTEIYEYAKEMGIPESIMKKAPSAGLWEGQRDEEEIGLSYEKIDVSLKTLELHRWQATTPIEEKVLELVRKSEHKRLPAPNLVESQKKL